MDNARKLANTAEQRVQCKWNNVQHRRWHHLLVCAPRAASLCTILPVSSRPEQARQNTQQAPDLRGAVTFSCDVSDLLTTPYVLGWGSSLGSVGATGVLRALAMIHISSQVVEKYAVARCVYRSYCTDLERSFRLNPVKKAPSCEAKRHIWGRDFIVSREVGKQKTDAYCVHETTHACLAHT